MVDNVVEIIMKKMSGEKKDSGHCTKYCHIFFTASIFTFFLVCNFYFFNHMKNNNDLLDQRVKHLENDAVFVKEIATNITQLLSDMTNDVGGSNKSVSGRLNNEGRKRIKRDNDEKPIDNHKKTDEKSIEQTLHSLRREMFSLNDRLRFLLRYGGENVGIPKGGPPGPPGSPGKSGSPGPPGINGINGYHGERGAKGPIGPPGSLGPEGPLGKDGIPGINGIPGIPGYAGRKGEKGNPGRDGRTGNEGISGQTGRDGPPGRPGRTGQKGEVGDCTCADVKSKMPNLTERRIERPVTDLVYTIWGSSTCPSANDILFSGEVAVGKFDHSDGIGSSNPICFPLTNRPRRRAKRDVIFEERITTRSPEMPKRSTKKNMEDNTYFNKTFTNYTNGTSSPNRSTTTTPLTNSTSSANVYPFIPKYAKLTGTRKYVPCASCHVKRKSVKMMIPSRIHCPPSWTIEYQGYLMNYHHNSKESEVLCVYDQALGVSPSSDEGIRHIISSYMTHLRIDCHSFPCPPFHEELLKCVVCSK